MPYASFCKQRSSVECASFLPGTSESTTTSAWAGCAVQLTRKSQVDVESMPNRIEKSTGRRGSTPPCSQSVGPELGSMDQHLGDGGVAGLQRAGGIQVAQTGCRPGCWVGRVFAAERRWRWEGATTTTTTTVGVTVTSATTSTTTRPPPVVAGGWRHRRPVERNKRINHVLTRDPAQTSAA